jgi:hypothetical protein
MTRFLQSPRNRFLAKIAQVAALLAVLAAPAALAAPWGPRHTGAGSNQDAYVLTLGKDSLSTNLDFDSYARMRQRHSGDFLWFRRGGVGYLIEDPAMLREAQELFAPLRALEPEQKDLSRRQEALSEKEEALDREQDALDSEIDRLTEETGEGGGDWDDEFSVSDEMQAAPPTDEERAEIDRELGELRNQQDALRPRQHELEAKNRELDSEERALDAREEKLERAAESRLWELMDAAIRSGVAKPAEAP